MKNHIKISLSLLMLTLLLLISPSVAFASEYHSPINVDSQIIKLNDEDFSELGEIDGEPVSLSITLSPETTQISDSYENEVSAQAIHVPNTLVATISPYTNGFILSFSNIGLDRISYVELNVDIYKHNGDYVTSKKFTDTNVKVGNTTYTWLVAKSATVQETVYLSGYAIDGVTYPFGSTSTVRYNFAGGSYGAMSAYEGQKHHIPSDSVTTITTYSGPAIRMLTEDHRMTASYGSSAAAVAFRAQEQQHINNGRFDLAMQMGINDLRSLFGTKYDNGISEMINYAVGKGYISSGTVN